MNTKTNTIATLAERNHSAISLTKGFADQIDRLRNAGWSKRDIQTLFEMLWITGPKSFRLNPEPISFPSFESLPEARD